MKLNPRFTVARPTWALILGLTIGLGLFAPRAAYAAFGLTGSGSTSYTVDTGAGLVFKVDTSGNITSLKYNSGPELQDQSKSSGIASGFYVYDVYDPTTKLLIASDTVTTTGSIIGGNTIVITVNDVAPTGYTGQLIHYYIVQKGVNNIYMATYMTQEPNVGELRYIMRLLQTQLPKTPAPSDNTGTTGAIESSDVFGHADGTTTSKYYGRDRAIDLTTRGVTGSGVGVYMIYGSRESSSGGPFYRDIQNQTTGAGGDSELYNYMNSGHEQTEAIRTNVLYGPYVYAFTNGTAPAIPDLSFIANLGLTGYVDSTGRASVSIAGITGRDTTYPYTVGFANATAQYWTTADPATGSAVCAGMKPGDYTMTVYKGELGVYTGSVTVTAGSVTALNTIAITGDPSALTPIWRIGDWDGTPNEFLHSDKIINMHPSDSRIVYTATPPAPDGTWSPGIYTVGTSSPFTGFPCYQWKAVNGSQEVQFSLTSAQVAAHTIRVGITAAYAGGRPDITVNSWTPSSLPSASSQPDSRSLTVGTYRGNNTLYTFNAPASAFVAGVNTMYISVISGSSGTTYLSPGYSVDAVDLLAPPNSIGGTISLQWWMGAPQPLTVTLTPTGGTTGSVVTQTITPAVDGSFILTNVSPGTYTLGIQGSKWLKKNVSVDTTGGSVSGLSVSLLGGDANGDNQVSGYDYLTMRRAYGTALGQTGYDAHADFNGDGQVNGTDYLILRQNYGKNGDP